MQVIHNGKRTHHKMRTVVLAFAAFLAFGVAAKDTEKKIVCYLNGVSLYRPSLGKFELSRVDPQLCTHLIYTYIGLTEEGDIDVLDPAINSSNDSGPDPLRQFSRLRLQNNRLKILISLGGWNQGSEKFSKVLSNPELGANLVENIVKFCKRYRLHGLDLDWRYPAQRGGSPQDVENYVCFLQNLRQRFNEENLLLSVSVPAFEALASISYNIPDMAEYPHFINLQAYDYRGFWDKKTGAHAPLYQGSWETGFDRTANINASVNFWLASGVPPEKLILGIPLFGNSFMLDNKFNNGIGAPASRAGPAGQYTGISGTLGFNEICEMQLLNRWEMFFDNEQRVPVTILGDQWISYENVESVKEKALYIQAYNLGGAAMSSIDVDDFRGICGPKYPLLRAVNEVFRTPRQPTKEVNKRPNQGVNLLPLQDESGKSKFQGNQGDQKATDLGSKSEFNGKQESGKNPEHIFPNRNGESTGGIGSFQNGDGLQSGLGIIDVIGGVRPGFPGSQSPDRKPENYGKQNPGTKENKAQPPRNDKDVNFAGTQDESSKNLSSGCSDEMSGNEEIEMVNGYPTVICNDGNQQKPDDNLKETSETSTESSNDKDEEDIDIVVVYPSRESTDEENQQQTNEKPEVDKYDKDEVIDTSSEHTPEESSTEHNIQQNTDEPNSDEHKEDKEQIGLDDKHKDDTTNELGSNVSQESTTSSEHETHVGSSEAPVTPAPNVTEEEEHPETSHVPEEATIHHENEDNPTDVIPEVSDEHLPETSEEPQPTKADDNQNVNDVHKPESSDKANTSNEEQEKLPEANDPDTDQESSSKAQDGQNTISDEEQNAEKNTPTEKSISKKPQKTIPGVDKIVTPKDKKNQGPVWQPVIPPIPGVDGHHESDDVRLPGKPTPTPAPPTQPDVNTGHVIDAPEEQHGTGKIHVSGGDHDSNKPEDRPGKQPGKPPKKRPQITVQPGQVETGVKPVRGPAQDPPVQNQTQPGKKQTPEPKNPPNPKHSGPKQICHKEGYVRDPHDCKLFYYCKKLGNGYHKYNYNCPANLVFDVKISVCNWPYNVPECSQNQKPPRNVAHDDISDVPETSSRPVVTTSKAPTHSDLQVIQDVPKPPQAVEEVCKHVGYNRDPHDCSIFYYCEALGKGYRQYKFNCPPTLFYDLTSLTCNWPYNVPECH